MKTLVVGCGYVGLPLALEEKTRGSEVAVWVHSPESAAALGTHAFAQVIVGSVADDRLWNGLSAYNRVVHCASSGRGGPEAYREVFLEGTQRMNTRQPGARKLLVSSTSVYGQTDGEFVSEESGADPTTETGKILREAEELALAGGAIVVRSAGIYGPGRAVLFEKLKRGEAVMEGDGSRWMNQVHRDDLVSAIELLLEKGEPPQIYNASDNTPVTHAEYYRWCSDYLRLPMPPMGPVNTQRKRGNSNKRISNSKLRAMGWRPNFGSFQEGILGAEAGYSPR